MKKYALLVGLMSTPLCAMDEETFQRWEKPEDLRNYSWDQLLKDSHGRWLLDLPWAAARGNCVPALRDHFKEYPLYDSRGYAALHYAVEAGAVEAVRYLLSDDLKYNKGLRTLILGEGKTSLHLAAEGNHHEIIELLCAAQPAMLRSEDGEGRLPGEVSGVSQDTKELLAQLAKIHKYSELIDGQRYRIKKMKEARGSESFIPSKLTVKMKGAYLWFGKICLAAYKNDVKILTENGTYGLHSADFLGRAPVHWAAVAGSVRVIQALSRDGFHIFTTEKRGATALHLAAEHNRHEVITFLCDLCPGLMLMRDKKGRLPEDYAKVSRETKDLLRELRREKDCLCDAGADAANRAVERATDEI